jgi:hypothetical protein
VVVPTGNNGDNNDQKNPKTPQTWNLLNFFKRYFYINIIAS